MFWYNFFVQATGLRCLNGAALASLKKYAAHFFNSGFAGTEPNEAPYKTTGGKCEWKLGLSLLLKTQEAKHKSNASFLRQQKVYILVLTGFKSLIKLIKSKLLSELKLKVLMSIFIVVPL